MLGFVCIIVWTLFLHILSWIHRPISYPVFRKTVQISNVEDKFPLAQLPHDLAFLVLQKIPFCSVPHHYERVNLEFCSKYSSSLCNSSTKKSLCRVASIDIVHNKMFVERLSDGFTNLRSYRRVLWDTIADLDVRISARALFIKVPLTQEIVMYACEEFRNNETEVESINISKSGEVDKDGFLMLLEQLEPNSLQCDIPLPQEILDNSYLHRIESVEILAANISVQQLVSLRASRISISTSSLPPAGINQLIKEWKSGSRKLHYLYVEVANSVESTFINEIDNILPDIDPSLIWSLPEHLFSVIGKVPPHDIHTNPAQLIYSICRSDAIDDFRTLFINHFTVLLHDRFCREFDVFRSMISAKWFNNLFGLKKEVAFPKSSFALASLNRQNVF